MPEDIQEEFRKDWFLKLLMKLANSIRRPESLSNDSTTARFSTAVQASLVWYP